MGIVKRTIYGIMKRPFRSISLAVVLIISMIGTLFGIYLESVITQYKTFINQQIGYCINISSKIDNDDIPDELIKKIGSIDSVLGYVTESSIEVTPIDFNNYVPPDALSGDFDLMGDKSQIRLWGAVNTEYSSYFFQKQVRILSGDYPSENTNEVLIEKDFADYNNLSISDKIHVPREKDGEEVELKIVGIYEIDRQISGSIVISSVNEIYRNTPFSYIFCDYYILDQVASVRIPKCTYSFYAKDQQGADQIEDYIKQMKLDPDIYEYNNLSEDAAESFSNVMLILEKSANSYLMLGNISIYIILFLMTLLWMRDHYKEAGIYIALGRNRLAIIVDYLIELIAITVFVFFASYILFKTVLNYSGTAFIGFLINVNAQELQYQYIDKLLLNNSITLEMFMQTAMTLLIILFTADLTSSITILCYRSRNLFDIKN